MEILSHGNGSSRFVNLSGALTVKDSLKLKKVMAENLRKGQKLELVFGDVTEMDVSIVQIMASAVKTAEAGDRVFTVRTPVPETVAQTLKLSGFMNHFNCVKQDCVWCAIDRQLQGA